MPGPAFVQAISTTSTGGGSITSLQSSAFGTQPVAGNAIVVGVITRNSPGAVSSVTDNAGGNTYSRLGSSAGFTSLLDVELWAATNINTVASFKPTANFTSSLERSIIAFEISGLGSGSILDQSSTGIGTSGSPYSLLTSSTPTTTNANDILIAVGAVSTTSSGTWTAGSIGGTTGQNLQNVGGAGSSWSAGAETQSVSSIGAYTAALNNNAAGGTQDWALVLVALGNLSGAAPPPVNFIAAPTVMVIR